MLGSPLHLSDCVNLSFIKVCRSMMYEVFKRTTAGEVWKYDRMKITKYEGLTGRWFWSKYQSMVYDVTHNNNCLTMPGKDVSVMKAWVEGSVPEVVNRVRQQPLAPVLQVDHAAHLQSIKRLQIISYHQNWGHFDEDEHLVACGDVHNRVKT